MSAKAGGEISDGRKTIVCFVVYDYNLALPHYNQGLDMVYGSAMGHNISYVVSHRGHLC